MTNVDLDGHQVALRWLALGKTVDEVRENRDRVLACATSPSRDYQAAMEFVQEVDRFLVSAAKAGQWDQADETPGESVWVTVTIVNGSTGDPAGWLSSIQALDFLRGVLGGKMVGTAIRKGMFDGDWNIHVTPEYWAEVVESGEATESGAFYDVEVSARPPC